MFFPKELPDLQLSSVAARARVATHEDALHGGLRVQHRARALRRVMHAADNSFRVDRFGKWLKGSFLFSLEAAADTVRQREQHLQLDTSMLLTEGLPIQARLGWQARATKLLRSGFGVEARLHVRKRLDRWLIPTLPGHWVARWLNVLSSTSKLVPPRVRACQFRVAFNGWTTSRRMQKAGSCILGCPNCQDEIEHYAVCINFHKLCKQGLGLDRPPTDNCLEYVLGIAPHFAALPHASRHVGASPLAAALRAMGVFLHCIRCTTPCGIVLARPTPHTSSADFSAKGRGGIPRLCPWSPPPLSGRARVLSLASDAVAPGSATSDAVAPGSVAVLRACPTYGFPTGIWPVEVLSNLLVS